MQQRGFTLVEITVAAAIAALLLCASAAFAGGWRPAAASASALEFDAEIAAAQNLARASGNGSTLVVQSAAGSTVLRLYSGRPDAAGAMSVNAPDISIDASLSEMALGAPPFTIFFDSAGYASAMKGTVAPSNAAASDPGCPAGAASLQFRVVDARAVHARSIACAQ